MIKSPNLQFDLLMPNQAQKEITVNHAFLLLDGILNNGVLGTRFNPPENPQDGDLYIVLPDSDKQWLKMDNHLSFFFQKQWYFIKPKEGFKINKSNGAIYTFLNNKWIVDKEEIIVKNETLFEGEVLNSNMILNTITELECPGYITCNSKVVELKIKGLSESGEVVEEIFQNKTSNIYKFVYSIELIEISEIHSISIVKSHSVLNINSENTMIHLHSDLEISVDVHCNVELTIVNNGNNKIQWKQKNNIDTSFKPNSLVSLSLLQYMNAIYCKSIKNFTIQPS